MTTCIPCGSSWLRQGCAVPNCWAFAGTTRTRKQVDSLSNNGSCLWRPSRSFSSARSEKAGRRLLKLDRATVQVLASWRVAQIEERLATGEKWDDTGLVFTQLTGAGIHPERVSRRFAF